MFCLTYSKSPKRRRLALHSKGKSPQTTPPRMFPHPSLLEDKRPVFPFCGQRERRLPDKCFLHSHEVVKTYCFVPPHPSYD